MGVSISIYEFMICEINEMIDIQSSAKDVWQGKIFYQSNTRVDLTNRCFVIGKRVHCFSVDAAQISFPSHNHNEPRWEQNFRRVENEEKSISNSHRVRNA